MFDTQGKRLKHLRDDKGLTTREVGEAVGVTWSQISRYERDEASPRPKVLIKLCSLYGATLEYVRDGVTPEQESARILAAHPEMTEEIELQIPPDLFAYLLEECSKSGRSMNEELNVSIRMGMAKQLAERGQLTPATKRITRTK